MGQHADIWKYSVYRLLLIWLDARPQGHDPDAKKREQRNAASSSEQGHVSSLCQSWNCANFP